MKKERADQAVGMRMAKTVLNGIDELADSEERSRSNMILILIKEALKARQSKQTKQGEK